MQRQNPLVVAAAAFYSLLWVFFSSLRFKIKVTKLKYRNENKNKTKHFSRGAVENKTVYMIAFKYVSLPFYYERKPETSSLDFIKNSLLSLQSRL